MAMMLKDKKLYLMSQLTIKYSILLNNWLLIAILIYL